jgi:hypothetical protein
MYCSLALRLASDQTTIVLELLAVLGDSVKSEEKRIDKTTIKSYYKNDGELEGKYERALYRLPEGLWLGRMNLATSDAQPQRFTHKRYRTIVKVIREHMPDREQCTC